MRRFLTFAAFLTLASLALAQAEPADVGANKAAQCAADAIKVEAQSDGAFLAAGLINIATFDKDNLASILTYPTEKIVVVKLTGAQIKQALERSVSLFPQPNPSFLQLSGFSATFKKSAATGSRILTVKAGDDPIDPAHTYMVAMPASLGGGTLGYFKIWDKSNIVKTLDKTGEAILKDKHYADSPLRWSAE
jgi:2',3'-cyclic-nucleotide 2'-phosphodiesterase (5'-nucleotidase family)